MQAHDESGAEKDCASKARLRAGLEGKRNGGKAGKRKPLKDNRGPARRDASRRVSRVGDVVHEVARHSRWHASMLLLGMADGGISILRLNRPWCFLCSQGRHLRPARLPHRSDLASADECRPGLARLHRSLRSGFSWCPPTSSRIVTHPQKKVKVLLHLGWRGQAVQIVYQMGSFVWFWSYTSP